MAPDLPLAVHVWRPEPATIRTPDILAVPTAITGIYDDGAAFLPATADGEPPPCVFKFSFAPAGLAGSSWDVICQMAARLAAHIAAMDDAWPGLHAHVRGFPVVDFGDLGFMVTPQYVPPADSGLPGLLGGLAAQMSASYPETGALLQKMADDAALCAAGECECTDGSQ